MATKGKARGKAAKAKKPAKPAAKLGHRPTDYRESYDQQAYKLCLLGATDAKLADFFNVTEQTVNNWKTAHPTFFESIKAGKEIADADIAESLFHRAKGYSHPEDDIRTLSGAPGQGSEIVITPTIKHYPPDTQAASLWLRNRQPKLWRDKIEQEISGPNGGPQEHKVDVALTADEAYLRMIGK